MDKTMAERIASRFVTLSKEQRRQILGKMRESGQSFRLLPIVATRNDRQFIPLSYSQKSLLFMWQMEPSNSFYNIPMAVHLSGVLDLPALERALGLLLLRHESLRTRFVSRDGEFHQEIMHNPTVPMVQIDMRGQGFAVADPGVQKLIEEELGRPFDLMDGPLLRAGMFRLAEADQVLTLCMHHIVSDGWSGELLVEELIHLYEAERAERPANLPELPIQYADYAIWQQAWLEAGEGERQLEYWRGQLGDEQPVLALPFDHERRLQPSYRGARVRADFSQELTQRLQAFAREGGYTLFMLVLSALAVVLSRYGGQSDIRIGAPNAGRNRKELEGLIGFFINTQVLRLNVDEESSFSALLDQAREVVAGAQAHQELPFERLVDALAPERSLGVNPLFQVKINQNLGAREAGGRHVAGLFVEALPLGGSDARFDLAFDFMETPTGIKAYFTYATDLFEADTIERMSASLHEVLEWLVCEPLAPILRHLEASAHPIDSQRRLFPHADFLALWQRSVSRRPDQIAVATAGQHLSYVDLDHASNRLAQYLQDQGITAGVTVALCQERSIDWVTSLLAVLKLGAVYLPLDNQQPAERLQQLLHDSGAALLIYTAENTAVAAVAPCPRLAYQPGQWADYSTEPLDPPVDPLQPAYIIYTSGSTGQPKGVVVSHQALANYLQAVLQRLDLPEEASLALVSTIAADLGHTLLFGALASGRTLHLLSHEHAFDPDRFAQYMAEQRIDVLKIVPSHLQGLLQAANAADVLPERALILGGEACPWPLVEKVRALKPQCRIINHYGPTETTVGVLTHEVAERLEDSRSVPVGLPLANVQAAILDDYLNPVPPRVAGELYLGGPTLAQGYLGRPAATAERFVPAEDGGRLYRTGDRARLTNGQVLEFVGRADDQVKIRGYRVEPGEVGQVLASLPGVREAVMLALPLDSDEARLQLVGYAVVDSGIGGEDLQQAMKERLPDYLVPAQLILLERLPLTANGKLDKRALPKPGAIKQQYVAPSNEIESILASVWADVLKLEQVGTTDNFFELGGDSILSLQIIARAKRQGLKLTPKQLFEKQTIGQLAQVAKKVEAKKIAEPEDEPVTGRLPLLPIQSRFFERAIPQRQHWNQSILLKPHQPLQAEPLQAALQTLLNQHDALRLRFSQVEGSWHAEFQASETAEVLWHHQIKVAELPALAEEAQRSLNLEQGPLFRALLVELERENQAPEQRLLLIAHHLVVDGVSWRVLLEDLQSAYQAIAGGGTAKLPAKTSSLKSWAEHLQAHARSEVLQNETEYWLTALDGAPQDLPRDNPNGEQTNRHAAAAHTHLNAELTEKLLKQTPAAYRTQINDLLLTALARVLCQWTGESSALIQLEGHGREDLFEKLDISRTVGWFTSLFPVKLTPAATLATSIKSIKEQLRAVPGKGLGYGILRYLGSDETRQQLATLPEARVTFNYLGQFDGSFSAQDCALFTPAGESSGNGQDEAAPLGNWLSINGQVYGGELHLAWSFSQDVYQPATIERLAKAYEQALAEVIEHCADENRRGITPSDFPLTDLTQQQLDGLPIPAREIEDIYPLSPMQEGMLFHTLFDQEAGDYINQLRVDIEGLEIERFQQAWQNTFDRHDVLRTNFVTEFERPVQIIRKRLQMPFTLLDWRQKADLQPSLDRHACEDRQRGFDLSQDPLLRLTLIQTDSHRHHLILTRHHILLDGWSSSRLIGEVLQHYRGQQLETLHGRYRDYIAWLQQQDQAQSESFWRSQFNDLQEPTRLGQAIRQDKADLGAGYGDHYQALDQQQTQQLSKFARQQRVTVNTLVQAAWLLLLQRYTGQECVSFGAAVAGRPADLKGVEQQLGLFINTLPVIASPKPEQSVAQWIEQVQAQNLALREHEHTPLYEVQRWAGLGGESLFDNILVFENYPVSEALQQSAPDELSFGEVANQEQTNYPLTLAIGLGDTLSIHYSYDRRHFSETTVRQIARHFDNLLDALTQRPRQPLGELPLLSAEEQQQIIHDWNRTKASYPSEQCIHQLIELQVEKTPDAVAVVFGDQELTYRQLNQRVNRLAHKLREFGVGPDVLVGIAVERSLEMVVGLLAILKAGGAYVPLDPEYPQDRLAYMMEDSSIALLLTQAHLQGQLPIPENVRSLNLEQGGEWLEGYSEANPSNITQPENLAYVIYTSGSTGKPKGTLLPHHNVMRLFQATQDWYRFDADDVWSVFHSYAFDFSVWELLGALLHGAKAVVVPKEMARSPEDFHALLVKENVTVLNQTPSAFKQLIPVAVEKAQQLSLRYVIFGGEALDVGSLKPWLDIFSDRQPQLINMYGITETTVHVTYRPIIREDLDKDAVSPIGEVIPDLSWYLLDGNLGVSAPGSHGELHIGRAGLARGYHQRPALTAERFIPDPFDNSEQGGGRLYRTGDLARYRTGGVIEYAGRIDHQVKIRGFRIELGEIEAMLQKHAAVREVLVIDVEGASGKQLAAYLVADAGLSIDSEQQATLRTGLRDYLKEALPDYMAPAYLIFLEEMPLTPNGKLDRKALPKPDASQLQQEYVAPQSELEQQIAAIWAEVLTVERVGLNDNFFELGGHSLLATQVVVRIRSLMGIDASLRELFEHSQLVDFAKSLENKTRQLEPLQTELAKSLEALKRLTLEEIDELTS